MPNVRERTSWSPTITYRMLSACRSQIWNDADTKSDLIRQDTSAGDSWTLERRSTNDSTRLGQKSVSDAGKGGIHLVNHEE